ncbi:MAG: hypothetical protein IT578_04715 [Verrucomicrobiae bacterium]|nr:hypothetical protein [Verrucomicrobiae bacterium]
MAFEAEEKRAKARELDRRIRELNRRIAQPQALRDAHAAVSEDNRASLLRRLLRLPKAESERRRPPLLNEKRRHRNRTILWAVAGLITLIWALGRLLRLLSH